jgi:hypothetical protein
MNVEDFLLDATDGFTLDAAELKKYGVEEIHPTGSKYICNPPVLTTDEDYYGWSLQPTDTIGELMANGWTPCTGQEYEDDDFYALRKGVYNLIILFKPSDYETHVQTTELAKRFNLTNKQDRIDLFELVRNGRYE